MSLAQKIWHIEDSGPLVRIDSHNLPDLDDLMLEVLTWGALEAEGEAWWRGDHMLYDHPRLGQIDLGGDRATYIPNTARQEAEIGWYRTDPCHCGEEHTFDLDRIDSDDKPGRPATPRARGAFMAVYFS